MSINDLIEQGITIEGKVIISEWEDDEKIKETNIEIFEFKQFNKNLLYLEIKFMYCKDNKLCIEVIR